MASPNAIFVSGAVYTAAQANNFPFGLMGSAENLALAQTFTTIVDLTSMTVTFTGVASRRYRVDGYLLFQSTVANDGVNLQIRNSAGTVLQQAIYPLPLTTSAYMATTSVVIAATGSTTVKLSAVRQYGTGTITANGGATFPCQMIITDIGTL